MVDMYRAIVSTSNWNLHRSLGLRVKLSVRPLSLFLDDEYRERLLRFGNVWQRYMRECGIECGEVELIPSYAYESNYFIRILSIMEFPLPSTRYPTVWFALSIY